MTQALRENPRPVAGRSGVPPLSVVRSVATPSRSGVRSGWSRQRLTGAVAALCAGALVWLATGIPGSQAAWGVLAWAMGWLYLAWAVDARSGRALATDLLLAGVTLIGAAWIPGVAAWAVFLGHAGAGWLRHQAGARDAHQLGIWIGVHLGIAAVLWFVGMA